MSDILIEHAELAVWHEDEPRSDDPTVDPSVVIDGRDAESISIQARAQDVKDEAKFVVHYPEYSTDEYDIRVGDRVELRAELESPGGAAYGTSPYGSAYGSIPPIEWMGRVLPVDRTREHVARGTIQSDATDYVGAILSNRTISKSWIDTDVGAVIRDICERKASEVDASNVPDLGVSTDVFFSSRDCWDGVQDLASRADCMVYADGVALHVEPIGGHSVEFAMNRDDYVLPWSTNTSDDIKNVVRVESGVTGEVEQEQLTQDDWQRVTATNRLTHQIRTRKSAVHSIDIYVDGVADGESLRVRLQADENGAPIAINDEDSDIERAEWDGADLPNGGFRRLFFGEHSVPERDTWMIVETDGDTGHDIGVDANGVPTYRSYYPHPVQVEVSDPESIEQYGEREIPVPKQNLATLTAARDAAFGELARRAYPSKTIEFEADSPRAHLLEPGDWISVDEPAEDAVGEFAVVEVDRQLGSASNTIRLRTTITATWRKGILADV